MNEPIDFSKNDENAETGRPADAVFDGEIVEGDATRNGSADTGAEADMARQESWRSGAPAELEIAVESGRIEVRLDVEAGATGDDDVRVGVRLDPSGGGGWARGLSGIINWIGNATGGSGFGGSGFGELADLGADAVRAVEITWSDTARRLVVRGPKELPLRAVPLIVTVTAPAGSRLSSRTGSGDVTITGRAAKAGVRTGSGRILAGSVDGDADAETGSGDIDFGPIGGRAKLRTGSGGIVAASLGGTAEVRTSSGNVTLGSVAGDLGARTGSGDLEITDARSGTLDITSGSGDLRVSVHPGVAAQLDLSSGSGKARSELDVSSSAPESGAALRVRGRTGSGDVVVRRAMVAV